MIREAESLNGGSRTRRVHFACGAMWDLGLVPLDRNGNPARIMVFAVGKPDAVQPRRDGKPAPCLFGCPAKVAESGRRQLKAWLGEDAQEAKGEPVWCVLCRPVRVTEVDR